ncbi:MAG: hypothetical protein Q8R28_11485 [Dehalococcoidia bacterium]|nr:hypothetical protein [Dehalococcoidia bacterium]
MTTLQQAFPQHLEVAPDTLQARLEVFTESCVLTTYKDHIISTRLVHPLDVAQAFVRELSLSTGILPPDTLWWVNTKDGPLTALWRPPKVWRVALQLEAMKPAERLAIPMPGLVFLCSPGKAPSVWAAKRRPAHPQDKLYHAPLFNVFGDARTCPGTHSYPQRVPEAPESFFAAFFTQAGMMGGRSKKYPRDLAALWRELDGKAKYPTADLVEFGRVGKLPGMDHNQAIQTGLDNGDDNEDE